VQKVTKPFNFWMMLLAFILSGCGANIDRSVIFYPNEAWQATIKLTMPIETAALYGSVNELEASIAEEVAGWEAKGAKVSWQAHHEETALFYSFQIDGTGWALLNDVVFENNAQIFSEEGGGNPQIHFSYFATGDLLSANSNTITLTGGKIISSNGNEINPGEVQWINPGGRVEAVLTEKSRLGFSTLLVVLLLLGGAGIGFWFYRQKARKSQFSTYPQSSAFCVDCGAQLSPRAKFCPKCGHKQT